MIYILTSNGPFESGFFEDAFTDKKKAVEAFEHLKLTADCPVKTLWVKEPGGKRSILMEERLS